MNSPLVEDAAAADPISGTGAGDVRSAGPKPKVYPFTPPAATDDPDRIGPSHPFPIGSLPPSLQEIALDMAAVYQTPVCLPVMAALGVLSGAVGRSVQIKGGYKNKVTRLNIHVFAVSERGTGKGVIGETLSSPLKLKSQELAEDPRQGLYRAELGVLKKEIQVLEGTAAKPTCEDRGNLIDLLTRKQNRAAELQDLIERKRTLWVSNTTSEAMAKALADNDETSFCFSTEAGEAVQVALGKYTDGEDLDLLLSGYSGDAVRMDRIGRRTVQLMQPCLALLWFFQQCVLDKIVGNLRAMARGGTARPLIFATGAERQHDDRSGREFAYQREWDQLVNGILNKRLSGSEPLVLVCTPEATEVFALFHDESVDLERVEIPQFVGETSRWRENAIKVAGLLAVVAGATEITADLAQAGVEIVRWCGTNYLDMLRAAGRRQLVEKLERLERLVTAAGGRLSLGDAEANHGLSRREIDAIIKTFPGRLEIQTQRQPGAGRPREFITRPVNQENPS